VTNAGSLGGDKCLKVDDVEERRFHELGFSEAPFNGKEWFVGKESGPLRWGDDLAAKAKCVQKIEKRHIENPETLQIGDFVIGKLQVFQVGEGGIKTGKYGISAVERVIAEEQIKNRGSVCHPFFQITREHGQFIEVCEEGGVAHGSSVVVMVHVNYTT